MRTIRIENEVKKQISIYAYKNELKELSETTQSLKVYRTHGKFIIYVKSHRPYLWNGQILTKLCSHLKYTLHVDFIFSVKGGDLWKTK